MFQGSSVTGVRRFSKPGIPAGTPFDVLKQSDFDIAISSKQLIAKAKELGIPLRGKGTRTRPLTRLDLEKLGLDSLPNALRRRIYRDANGRDINFIITDTLETAFSRGPSLPVPRR